MSQVFRKPEQIGGILKTGSLSANPNESITTMSAPVPWSLAWREDGELSLQDKFDLIENLVASEDFEVQAELIKTVESLTTAELSVISSTEVTRLCA